jgi:endonuclease YncB( thermonuclease family)
MALRRMVVIALMLVVSFLVPFLAPLAAADPIDRARLSVVDGDTIRIDRQKPDIQLLGFDAPEIRGARCDAEIDLGTRTARRLRTLVDEGSLDFSFVNCPCRPGTEGTAYCTRGRRCGVLKVNGRDVAETLIAEKLAVPLVCDETRCQRGSQTWCKR